MNNNNLFVIKRVKRSQYFKERRLREAEKINLAGGESGIQEMTGRTEIITGQSFFNMKEIHG